MADHSLRNTPVRDLEMTKEIKAVPLHTAAIDAFIIMHQEHLSSLAIVDEGISGLIHSKQCRLSGFFR